MKPYVQNLALLSAVIAFGCNSNKTEPQADQTKTESVTTEADAAQNESGTNEQTMEVKTIEGVVTATNHGKDGYTATIETKDEGVFQATISRANLKDPKQYRDFNANEIVKLSGDSWKMGANKQLTVREIL